jgi:hypothetical protein
VRQIDEGFASLCRSLLQAQIDFDVVDEESLAVARVEGDTLVVGWRHYDALVLPPMDTVHVQTMKTLTAFAAAKGTVLASALLPNYAAEGSGDDERIREMVRAMREAGALGGSTPGALPLHELLRSRCLPDCEIDPGAPSLLCTTILRPEGPAYFLNNVSSLDYEGWFTFCTGGTAKVWDPEDGSERQIALERTSDDRWRVRVRLRPFGALAVILARGE